MSIGLYQHSHFGLVRRYILSNRYLLQSQYDHKQHQNWTSKFQKFQQTYLKKKKIKFIIFPEELYIDKEGEQQDSKKQSKLTILYDHFPLTLGDQLRQRIKDRQPFSLSQLWYFLYCLIQGAQQLIQIHSLFNADQPLVLHPETILLNQLGFIKLLCFYSSPISTVRNPAFQTPTAQDNKNMFKKFLQQATYSVGKIMASLLLLTQLDHFEIDGRFDKLAFDRQLDQRRSECGILGNIILSMLQGVAQQRVLLHQIGAMLFPYEECLLNLEGFRLDRKLCRQSMVSVLVQSK